MNTAENIPREQHVWVVLPAYNEEQSLPPLLDRISDAMLHSRLEYTVLVVDDGSSDGHGLPRPLLR